MFRERVRETTRVETKKVEYKEKMKSLISIRFLIR